MTTLDGLPVLTATQMKAAEALALAQGATESDLMERAGLGVADWVLRLCSGHDVLILCGPGNNGGDGYVAARYLRERGMEVRIAATGEPTTDVAADNRTRWDGPVEAIETAAPATILVDALFGTGLSRPLDPALATRLAALVAAASYSVAVDVPSGVASDDGARLGGGPSFDLTLALGALKPAHVLQPAASHCGALRVIDIGVDTASEVALLSRPALSPPGPLDHKYSRGMVAVVAGLMPGAAVLTSIAALRSGAGYVALHGGAGGPNALVHRECDSDALADRRIAALVIGPGLGRGADAAHRLALALAARHAMIVDGDALHLVTLDQLRAYPAPLILTPHAGEFSALFGKLPGSKIDQARMAARRSGAVVVFKGADTVIAAPDGQVRVAINASPWLSTAGTGDVLAGAIAAALAGGMTAFDAAGAGVWLHHRAAQLCGAAFIADDLAQALSRARAGS